jgi:hypothetical protein
MSKIKMPLGSYGSCLDALKVIEAFADKDIGKDTAAQTMNRVFDFYRGREAELAYGAIDAAVIMLRHREHVRAGRVPDDDDLGAAREQVLKNMHEDAHQDEVHPEPPGPEIRQSLSDAMNLIWVMGDRSRANDDALEMLDMILKPYVDEGRLQDLVTPLHIVGSLFASRLRALRTGQLPESDTEDTEAIWAAVKKLGDEGVADWFDE